MLARTPASVVSQWKVDSESTTELMVAFHEELRRNEHSAAAGKAENFRTASLRPMQDAAFRHPYCWAGFVMVGDDF